MSTLLQDREATLAALAARFEDATPQEILSEAYRCFGPQTVLVTGFGLEGVALVDMLAGIAQRPTVLYLDTGLLFPETYETRDRLAARYTLDLVRFASPLTLEEQAACHGEELWKREPDRCCALRKVEPLGRALAGRPAWITGIRRDQTANRANAKPFEWDAKFELVKVNPLVRWTHREVELYVRAHDVPHNPLYERGYPSIGCTPCTRAIAPGEDARAGRWSGFAKTECGLHVKG